MHKHQKALIWDIPTRLFHWLLAICIVAQWATAELADDLMNWHFYIGYFTLGLIIFRLVWGFIGPRHARFSQFLVSPTKSWHYFKNLLLRKEKSYPGHNPVGGLIVPVVIIVIGIQAISGLFATDDVLHSGPYMSSVGTDMQATLDWLHHKTFDLITVIIVVHLLALIWHKFVAKDHIIKAMLTGEKEAPIEDGITSSKILTAIILITVIAAVLYTLVALAPPPSEFYF
jgi:cytochrome b